MSETSPLGILAKTDYWRLGRSLLEEFSVIKMVLKRGGAVLMLCWIIGFPFAVRTSAGKRENAEARVDYASTRQDIQRFEAAVNEAVFSAFSSSPFAVVQKAKGAYLEGYGISFAFLVNIHRAVVNTPFGEVIRSRVEAAPDLKKRRIEELKEKLIRVLRNNGDIFRQLPGEDWITIVAFIEDRNFPGEPSENKTIVMSVLKKDLDELGNRSDRLKEFKQRIKIVEY